MSLSVPVGNLEDLEVAWEARALVGIRLFLSTPIPTFGERSYSLHARGVRASPSVPLARPPPKFLE